jgi:fused signal recognition particle receptor
MAGFFKKLFNRITGKPTEEAVPAEVEQVALPAPEPEPEPEIVVEVEEPQKIEKAKAKPVAKAPAKSKAPPPPPPPPKKVASEKEAPKPAAKKAVKVVPPSPVPKAAKLKPAQIIKAAPPPPPVKATKAKPVPIAKVAPPPKPVKQSPPPKPIAVPEPEPEIIAPVVVAPTPPAPRPKPPASVIIEEPAQQKTGWFSRLKEGLSKSSKTITGSITAIFTKRKLDKETLQELEDTLIQADLGITVAERIIKAVSFGRYDKEIDPEEVKQILADEVAKVLKPVEVPFNFGSEKPFVILVVGVNGSGKTTTIGKLGSIAASEGFKVMFAACDTFRAAAIEQLTVWGNRIGAVTKSAPQGADSAGLAFDALKQAREDGTDILFIDTAGRLQNKAYLMDELDKVVRVIKKQDEAAPHAVLLVLDATTGQNALAQAEIFTKVAGVTGLIMTKLDGTARGGILVAIAEKFKLPIHAIGVGETIDDLQPFDALAFSRAIAGFDDV